MKKHSVLFDKESKILLLISLLCLIGLGVTLWVGYYLYPDGEFDAFTYIFIIGFAIFFIFAFLSYIVRVIKSYKK